MKEHTSDSIWNKKVRIVQSKKGYRFALDAVLLAHFLRVEPGDHILEIGTGNGVIPILLSQLKSFCRLVAVEIQPELASLARRNVETNGAQNIEIIETDMRDLNLAEASFDLIFSNPPYRKAGSGKLNPNSEKAIARHELKMRLADLFECAIKNLKPSGRLSLILPTFREQDFEALSEANGFVLLERQYIHSFASEAPVLFLGTIGREKRPLIEHASLTIYEAPGVYTSRTKALLTEA